MPGSLTRTDDAWFIGCSALKEQSTIRRLPPPLTQVIVWANRWWCFFNWCRTRITPISATINFSLKGLRRSLRTLQKRKVGFVVRRYPDHGLLRFCSEVRPCLVIADENPLMEAERTKTRIAEKIALPFWTVDSDVVVPAKLLTKEHYAARTIRPKIRALLPQFMQKVENPAAKFPWRTAHRMCLWSLIYRCSMIFPSTAALRRRHYFHGGSKKLSAVSKGFFDPGLKVTPPSATNPISMARANCRHIFISAISECKQ